MDEEEGILTDEFMMWCYRRFGRPWHDLGPEDQRNAIILFFKRDR